MYQQLPRQTAKARAKTHGDRITLISDVRPIQIATTVWRLTPPRHGGVDAGSARPNPGDSTSGESYARSPGRQAAAHPACPDFSVMPFEDLPGPWVAFRATLLGPCGWNLPANAGLVSAKEGPPCPGGTRAGGTRPWKPQVMPSLHDNNTSGLVARRRSRQRHLPTPLRLVPNTKGIAASPRQGNHNRPWASWHQDDTPYPEDAAAWPLPPGPGPERG